MRTDKQYELWSLKELRSASALLFPRGQRTPVGYWKKHQCIEALRANDQAQDVEQEPEQLPEPSLEPEPVKVKSKAKPGQDDSEIVSAIAKALTGRISAGIDEQAVNEIVDKAISRRLMPTIVTIDNKTTETTKNIGLAHEKLPDLLKLAQLRLDMFLVGAAGSGKTTVCEQIATALDIPFYFIPVGLQTTKSDLLGYMSATGEYVSTHLRQAYEHGGVFLLDEIDAGNPNVLTVINAMLANCQASFPDKMIARHKDFIFIGAGNTYGLGNDRQYVGRNQLDAATLDRFVVLSFDYDKALEQALCSNHEWLNRVWSIREAVQSLNEKMVVSPRASIKGAKMLSAGFTIKQVEDALIYRGINSEIKNRIQRKACH